MPGASTEIVMNVTPKTIYDIVLDFESYPEFLDDVKSVSVKKSGKSLQATFEVSVIKSFKYTLKFTTVANKKISWELVEGDMLKKNNGSWIFEPEGKGKTHVTYNIEVDLGLFVPSMVTNKLVGKNLPTMMQKFKERAEELSS